jgi:hypothetical protein
MKQHEGIQLSREDVEALLARLEANALTADDRRMLGKVLISYFSLLFALREAKLCLERIKALVFGEEAKPPKPSAAGGTASGGSTGEDETPTCALRGVQPSASPSSPEKKPPLGHERHGANVYRSAQTVECRHEELTVGERCPA